MKLIKNIGKFISKNERVLLTIVTIGGEAVAIWQGIKQGPKFKEIMEKVKAEEITKSQAAKEMIIPTAKIAVPFALSSSAAILNHKKASDTISNLTNLYLTTKTISDEYKAQAEKEMDPETAEKVETASYQAYRGPAAQNIYYTGHGTDLFYDEFSKQKFYSDANYIKAVVNDLNESLNDAHEYEENTPVLLNDLYDGLGLPHNDVFDNWVFDHDTGLIRYRIRTTMDDNNKFCGIIEFLNAPKMVSWER